MSIDLEKMTTRNLLDGLRWYATTFDEQERRARREEDTALFDAPSHHARPPTFGDLLPRLLPYGFVVHLAMIIKARLRVFAEAVRIEHDVARRVTEFEGPFLEQLHR